jgi:glutathione S-transferase
MGRMNLADLTLISHHLCPYVQRAVISLSEKKVAFERIDIDLSNKPAWFKQISPLGKTPVLRVGDVSVFESAVILEYLEETQVSPLHPIDPLTRAEHRSWIEFGSAILNDIAGFYGAPDDFAFSIKTKALTEKFAMLEQRVKATPYFDGQMFSLVDAVFGPVFRYFDIFDQIGDFGILVNSPKIEKWRNTLKERPSVKCAVATDYEQKLRIFLKNRNSHLSKLMVAA